MVHEFSVTTYLVPAYDSNQCCLDSSQSEWPSAAAAAQATTDFLGLFLVC